MLRILPILILPFSILGWDMNSVRHAQEASGISILQNIVDNLDTVIDDILEYVGLDQDMVDLDFDDQDNGIDDPDEYLTCAQCRSAIQLFISLINQGKDFEDVRDLGIDLCMLYVNSTEGWNGNIMCPGLVDAYGPHVFYILNVTNSSAAEICTLYNVCDPRNAYADLRQKYLEERKAVKVKVTEKKSGKAINRLNKKDMIKVLHLTDIHIDEQYAEGSATDCNLPTCCRDYWPGEGSAWYWGSYPCNLPLRTLESFLSQWATHDPDYIMYTGDSPPHSVWDETQERQLAFSKHVAEQIGKHFPDVPAFPCIGNHETYPANLYYTERPEIQEFNREFRKYWQPMANFTDDQIENVEYAGFYTMPLQPGLRVIAYNSNYGYNANFYGIITKDSPEYLDMLQFLEESFDEARSNNEKVILLGHHYIGKSNGFIFHSQWLSDLLVRFGDLVLVHLVGHTHADSYNMVMDETTGLATNVIISSPSVGARTDINPSGRIFYLDPETFTPMLFENYFFNLSRYRDDSAEPVLEFYYDSIEEYGMEDVTARSYQNFTDRMELDDDLFYKYRYNERTGNREVEPCDEECKTETFCEFRTSSYDQYLMCVEKG